MSLFQELGQLTGHMTKRAAEIPASGTRGLEAMGLDKPDALSEQLAANGPGDQRSPEPFDDLPHRLEDILGTGREYLSPDRATLPPGYIDRSHSGYDQLESTQFNQPAPGSLEHRPTGHRTVQDSIGHMDDFGNMLNNRGTRGGFAGGMYRLGKLWDDFTGKKVDYDAIHDGINGRPFTGSFDSGYLVHPDKFKAGKPYKFDKLPMKEVREKGGSQELGQLTGHMTKRARNPRHIPNPDGARGTDWAGQPKPTRPKLPGHRQLPSRKPVPGPDKHPGGTDWAGQPKPARPPIPRRRHNNTNEVGPLYVEEGREPPTGMDRRVPMAGPSKGDEDYRFLDPKWRLPRNRL